MLYDWIGDAAFKTGMHIYLTKYSYGNTETPQLWAELESASNLPVNSVMKSWTEQMGFPCITVTSQQEGADRVLTLYQSKFVGHGKANMDSSGSRWKIPVSISSPGKEVIKIMMDRETESQTELCVNLLMQQKEDNFSQTLIVHWMSNIKTLLHKAGTTRTPYSTM